MRALPIAIAFLLLLINSSAGFAYGAIVAGYDLDTIKFVQSVNKPTPQDALSSALNQSTWLSQLLLR